MSILYILGFLVVVGPASVLSCYSLITRMFEFVPDAMIATQYFQETATPLLECLRLCENDIGCHSMMYNNVSGSCWRSTDNVINDPSTVLTPNPDYRVYYKVPRCPDGWNWFRYRCYKFINTNVTWYDSRDNCEALGGWLALPRDMEHVAFFNNITTCTPGPSTCYPWLGFHDLDTEGVIQGLNNFTIPDSVLSVTLYNSDLDDCGYSDPEFDEEVYMYDCMDLAVSVCEKLE